MKKSFCLIIIFIISVALYGIKKENNGISQEMLEEIEASFKMNMHVKFAQNALAEIDARKIVLNREKTISVDPYFSNKLESQDITNQESTGRCWMFAGLNILRPFAAKKLNLKNIEFSENYLFFYDKLEKANMFLEEIIKTKNKPLDDRHVEFLIKHPISDGGQWVGMRELIKKYGLVPKDVMPETYSSSHSRTMNRVLGLKLREYALKLRKIKNIKKARRVKVQALKDVYKILVINFGNPTRSFLWRYKDKDKKITSLKRYTPKEFYKEVVNVKLDDYLALYSIPTRDYGKLYEIDLDKSVYDRPNLKFVNCKIETLKEIAKKSILDKQPVWFGCDVGKESFSKKGLMIPAIYDYESLYNMKFKLTRKELFETFSNNPTHAMVLTGVDIVNNKVKKWLVENSWGKKACKNGYYHMMDEWFGYYVQEIVVHKKYIPENIIKIFKTKATLLPPWDPMFRSK